MMMKGMKTKRYGELSEELRILPWGEVGEDLGESHCWRTE